MRLRFGAVTALTLVAAAGAQGKRSAGIPATAAIPATAPTQSVSNLPSAQPQVQSSAKGQSSVAWNGATLAVTGSGDSLRNILRQVARATGMKVTGGVPDEQVFGTYGPAPVQQVLTSLFNGLSVNMLLVNDSPTKPKELLLTARTGGATPPSQSQPLTAADDPAEVNLAQPRPGRHTSPESFSEAPAQVQPATTDAGPVVPLNDAGTSGAPATNASGQPESPNGVRTPEQIFDELRQRQQTNTNTGHR